MSGSDSDEENVIKYGTPLDPYEEDEIPSKRKYQQPSDQYAVDAYGRRRFHGAFTGGFSAGYGNSVGTLEGWTPASFKSSRSEKAEISNQRPEDYMDEEDRGEFGIAPQQLQTREEFTGQKRLRPRYHDGPIPGVPVLEQLIRPVHELAAVKILKKMGWREGQGIGNRLRKEEKRRAKQEHKVYGCYMPPELRQESKAQSDEDSTDSEFDYETLFAPDDYEPYVLKRKEDQFGLGYSGLSRHSVLGNMTGEYGESTSKSHLLMKEKGKKVSIRGQAFGVGAFETEDDDIYATEDMSHYDFALGEAEKAREKKPAQTSSQQVLPGFVKASKPLPPPPRYPPPSLPRDYRPAPAGARRSRFEPTDHPQRNQGLGRHELTAEARGALLGETPIPKTNDSEPTEKTVEPPKTTLKISNINFVSSNESENFIPLSTSSSVPKVFRPFINDPAKQARYEAYVKDKGALERDRNTDKLSEWERNRETLEFEQAAKLYKPLTGVMNDRFTHAAEPDDAANPLSAVAKSSANYGLATPEQIEAAKKGVYGVMTRQTTQWRPEPLVCKRFNVPELSGGRSDSTKQDKPKVSYSIFSYLETSVHDKESFTKEQSKFSGSKSITETNTQQKTNENNVKAVNIKETTKSEPVVPNKRLTVAELFMKESEKDLKTTEKVEDTIEKFDKMDLYKSIFLSDSEPEEVNAENNDFVDKPKNTERNLSPTRGIFANIDFDELNSWKRNDKTEEKDKKLNEKVEVNVSNTKDTNAADESAMYGPKIPENIKITPSVSEVAFKPVFRDKSKRNKSDSSSSDSWVDANEIKSKKLKKKKVKKHKSKHKKSKHKKKDR